MQFMQNVPRNHLLMGETPENCVYLHSFVYVFLFKTCFKRLKRFFEQIMFFTTLFLWFQAVKSHRKICVVTRSYKGVRGMCFGFLLAFDRYMNLCLIDVTEIWRSDGLLVDSVSELKLMILNSSDVLPANMNKRNISQLFITGNNIVLSFLI